MEEQGINSVAITGLSLPLPGLLVFHLGNKDKVNMKFFIFTCLLAVALAKHKMDYHSSSEESAIISEEQIKQGKNVFIRPSEETTKKIGEMELSSRPSSEESAEVSAEKNKLTEEEKYHLKQLNKISQIYQKLNLPLYLQASRQYQVAMNPWTHLNTRTFFPLVPTLNREQFFSNEEPASFSQEQYKQDKDAFMHRSQETTKKTADMESSRSSSTEESTEVVTEKTKLTEQEKNYLKQLNKIHQYYQKFPISQYLKAVQQYQKAVNPWDHIKTNTYQIFPFLV
ncbi:alpha-S2-casein-like [Dasypus novemcinctus]|uniref:alpha-S2-casein-like n=1 Tax=Dasypus novemcinctus TaxID=9361 RepID=UPI0039C9BC2E